LIKDGVNLNTTEEGEFKGGSILMNLKDKQKKESGEKDENRKKKPSSFQKQEAWTYLEELKVDSTRPMIKGFRSPLCLEAGCNRNKTTGEYCKLHYIKNWYKIKQRENLIKSGKLHQYVEELANKYPRKWMETIIEDLIYNDAFAKVIHDLQLGEIEDEKGENTDASEGTF